jgi:alginate O-acetyltransferase complex protein AlgI
MKSKGFARVSGLRTGGAALAIIAAAMLGIGLRLGGFEVPAWAVMTTMAMLIFLGLKILTLRGYDGLAGTVRLAGYLFAWPGLNARTFLGARRLRGPEVRNEELVAAGLKLALGLALALWATLNVSTASRMVVGWVGMTGIIFTLHFGAMHLASCFWRRAGVDAPPIMDAPLRAVSLVEFWSKRWNRAFADVARRFIFRPFARKYGVPAAGGMVFLVSGLIHDVAISLPARGGWGGPTLYFALQAAGIAAEKSGPGRRIGLGRGVRGWWWVLMTTVLPLPLLFHPLFVERVIIPVFVDLNWLIL